MSSKCAAVEIIVDKRTLGGAPARNDYSERCTEGHHEGAIKHTCSAGETDRFKQSVAHVAKKQKEVRICGQLANYEMR